MLFYVAELIKYNAFLVDNKNVCFWNCSDTVVFFCFSFLLQ